MAKFLEFVLENQDYAISVNSVYNISQPHKIVRVPRTPNFVLGVTHYRGYIFTVIDLKCLFGISNAPLDKYQLTINVCVENSFYALLTDNVLGVVDVNQNTKKLIKALNFQFIILNE